jgi:hypothetical protein
VPQVKLGIDGPEYNITFNGQCIDRTISDEVEAACDREFLLRFSKKATQVLLLRHHKELAISPEMLGRRSYVRRVIVIEGKTKTHTRAMYTDGGYRRGHVLASAIKGGWDNDEA